MQEHKAIVMD